MCDTRPGAVWASLTLLLFLSVHVAAQEADTWSYEVGGRTTFMVTSMGLSGLGAPFVDLPAGGSALAHASGLFVLWPRGDRLRMGVETLVGNSYGDEGTEILFQGAGYLVEVQTKGTWFVTAGVQLGGIIVSATTSASEGPVREGTSYKGSGLFGSPVLGVGRLFGSRDVRLVARPVWHLPGTEGLDAFDSIYLGLSLGFRR